MKMLAKFWRLRMINETGQTMTYNGLARILIRFQQWKFSSSGALVYATVTTEDLGFTTDGNIVNNGEVEGTVVENTTDLYLGVNGIFKIVHDLDAAVGKCRLYLEFTDDNSVWPSDSDDFVIGDLIQIAVLEIDNTGEDKSRAVNFEL